MNVPFVADVPLGVFVAGADQSFIMVTYEMIASHFGDVSDSAWVLSGYNLGYCVALPVVSKVDMNSTYLQREVDLLLIRSNSVSSTAR